MPVSGRERHRCQECIVKNLISCLVFSMVLGLPAAAQQKPTLPAGEPQPPKSPAEATQRAATQQIPLRVQLVVSRYQGEKKISSIPYTLAVVANQRDNTNVRMGVNIPVPQTVFKGGEGASAPVSSYNYRSVGTNIDCGAQTVSEGVFKLDLAVEDTSVFVPEKDGTIASSVPGVPAFRTFTSRFNLLLRDGQTGQHTAATDPVSGEVLRVDVTMNVLK
jgi:hypothetical protein